MRLLNIARNDFNSFPRSCILACLGCAGAATFLPFGVLEVCGSTRISKIDCIIHIFIILRLSRMLWKFCKEDVELSWQRTVRGDTMVEMRGMLGRVAFGNACGGLDLPPDV